MSERYENRKVKTLAKAMYREMFKERKVKFINHYETPKLPFMDASARAQLVSVPHIWKLGDRYYKLADEFYDDPTFWWVIARYNQKPLESDVKTGTVIYVPTPLEDVLEFINNKGNVSSY